MFSLFPRREKNQTIPQNSDLLKEVAHFKKVQILLLTFMRKYWHENICIDI